MVIHKNKTNSHTLCGGLCLVSFGKHLILFFEAHSYVVACVGSWFCVPGPLPVSVAGTVHREEAHTETRCPSRVSAGVGLWRAVSTHSLL